MPPAPLPSTTMASRHLLRSLAMCSPTTTQAALLSTTRSLVPATPSPRSPLKSDKTLIQTPSTAAPKSTTIRSYHSTTHPPPPPPFTPTEQLLLSAALKHVPTHGWTAESLALGARDTGHLDISPAVLADGEFGLVRWWLWSQREGLKERVKALEKELERLGVEERVEVITWERLKGNVEGGIVGRWQEALALMALPSYLPHSLKELALLADEIIYLAGDKSVDPSWYTKRASLSAIYAGTELFQTTDTSLDQRETRAFLRRRLDEARQVGGAVRNVTEWVGFTGAAVVNILRSKGVRI